MKTRKQKAKEYQEKYGRIPIDYYERLNWMVDEYKLSVQKMNEILEKRQNVLNNLFWFDYNIMELLEEPEGQSRPRVRILRSNYNQLAMSNSQLIHVYVPGSGQDQQYMRRLVGEELHQIDKFICTPCDIEYNIFLKTPSNMNVTDIFLCEIGLFRPPFAKPDWDNIAKKYCDMYNHNVWLDDALVIDGSVHKYYSILPRVEIKLRYLNCVYTRNFYSAMINRKDFDTNQNLNYLDRKGELV